MGMDLTNESGDDFQFSIHSWPGVIEQAIEHGWHPAGTLASPDWDTYNDFAWDKNYHTNDGQIVTATDAAELANALERCIESGDPTAIWHPSHQLPVHDALIQALGTHVQVVNMADSMSREDAVSRLRAFIAFCRKGSFRIY